MKMKKGFFYMDNGFNNLCDSLEYTTTGDIDVKIPPVLSEESLI